MEVFQYTGSFGVVMGAVGLVGSTIFGLRYTAQKANMEGKDETIKTQKEYIEALESKMARLQAENETQKLLIAKLESEAVTLKEVATQTPQIISLTEAITSLTREVKTLMQETRKGNR